MSRLSPRPSSNGTPLEDLSTSRTNSRTPFTAHNSTKSAMVHHKDEDSLDEDHIQENSCALTRTKSKRSPIKRLFQFGWGVEVLAIALALASNASIIALLVTIDGRPIPSWQHSIQPATIIAVLSAVAKAALFVPVAECMGQLKWSYFEKPRALNQMQTFDNASRGPWGALVLLWQTRGKALLASMGALTMLLAPALEPFTQQVIHLSSELVSFSNETAFFSYGYGISDQDLLYGASYGPQIRLNFTTAMMAAMLGRPSLYETEYCMFNDCEFPDITTLGACTVCETESVQLNNDFGCNYYTRYNSTDGTSQRQNYTQLQRFQEAITRDSGQNLSNYGMDCLNEKAGFPTFNINYDRSADNTNTGGLQGLGQPQGSSDPNEFSPEAVFGHTHTVRYCDGDRDTDYENVTMCGPFGYCASGFGRSLGGNNGDFDTIDTFTCFITTWGQTLERLEQFTGNLTRCRISLCAKEYHEVAIRNGTLHIGSTTEKSLVRGNKNSNQDIVATVDGYEDTFFIGSMTAGNISQMIETVAYSADFQEFLDFVVANSSYETVVQRMGDVVTDYIRSPRAHTGRVPGKAFGMAPFYHVQWAWLAMPLSIVVLSIAFLIATAVYSRRKPYLWKNSFLAAALYGLEGWRAEEVRSASTGRVTSADLVNSTAGVRAKLVGGKDGDLRFVRER